METYLLGLLIILVGIILTIIYFISKQLREVKKDLKITMSDLEALKEKVVNLSKNNNNVIDTISNDINEQMTFTGNMFNNNGDNDYIILDDNNENQDENYVHYESVEEQLNPENSNIEFNESDENQAEDLTTELNETDNSEFEESTTEVQEEVDSEELLDADNDGVELEKSLEEDLNESKEETNNNETVVEDEKTIAINLDNKKKTYKQPSQKAKDYDEGDEVVSEFDGCKYVVSKDKRNRRRWKRVVEANL